ncbi:hypothetical protein TPHA_0F00130 [Tetrapisispora phaffii CBS 4417]|uniref:Alpha-1,3-mannosyltransferase n=1 Tax=Tetrapisispora phaffii (strain ATCC 24235 / CBS 4417 / NBRC 1672 / NRRL Y-8282 / UCD 70-5) TaxID=1071381 RepID=G8BUR8_TETPH|nr:hypothetical protein TPHA_0F00130 [Tetrapisispora phaffii CBS 4417]CCE63500.1 hypothetical protein TPHA_0F00130 [Tetrapisispora phaffii CBS 4417]
MANYSEIKRIIINRRSCKFYIYVVSVLSTIFITLHLSNNYLTDATNTPSYRQNLNNLDNFKLQLSYFNQHEVKEEPVSPIDLIPKYNTINKSSYNGRSFVQRVIDTIKGNSYKDFSQLDLQTKCLLYYRNLYAMNENWSNSLEQFSLNINDINDKTLKAMKEKFGDDYDNVEVVKSHKKKNDLALGFERIRLYDKCFLGPESVIKAQDVFNKNIDTKNYIVPPRNLAETKSTDEQKEKENDPFYTYLKYDQYDLDHRMFPFIKKFNAETFKDLLPRITNGKVKDKYLDLGVLPVLDKHGKLSKYVTYHYDPEKTFWGNWNAMSSIVSKRGIVLSFSDKHVDTFLRLLTTLRFQQNDLPIQVIHVGDDLSEESKHMIYRVATSQYVSVPVVDSKSKKIKQVSNLPAQQIWFVNVSNVLDPAFMKKFDRFKNKWLAEMLNLFEEFIFLDTDAISYIHMSEYFEFPEYKDTGTLFFKDRTLEDYNKKSCTAAFRTLPPKMLETINFGNFPVIDDSYVAEECNKYLTVEEKIYKHYFFDNWLHQMESGLIVINKSRHIMPIVISTMLHMTGQLNSCSYGDKEFLWLGFLISGTPYRFHDVNAGAMGDVLTEKDNLEHIEQRICVIQISHFNKDNHLLWVNGGARNCKFEDDAKKIGRMINLNFLREGHKSFEEFKEYYVNSPISAQHGIIPGDNPGTWNKLGEHCRGYNHCAKFESKLTPFSFDDRKNIGKIFKFSPSHSNHINVINTIWTNFNYSPDMEKS